MYKCSNCWFTNIAKLWKCNNCWEFWTFELDKTRVKIKNQSKNTLLAWNSMEFDSKSNKINFYNIEDTELKRIFQRWIKAWWIYLLGWEPWIGKSTIILQIIQEILANNRIKIWYFTWEENSDQIIDRLSRITDINYENNLEIFHSTKIEDIIITAEDNKYDIIVIDSIQTIYFQGSDSPFWSPNQVKFCSEKIMEFCKKYKITWFIIGHVTKGWEIAWPKYLEHIVDVVMYLEWDRFGQYRFLRNKKNRFWNTDNLSIFEMTNKWLKPVYDIKERIINSFQTNIPGSVLTIWIDNWRPVIVNLEVLINKTNYKFPQRTSIWVDNNRLNLIIAILERYLNLKLWYYDIYVNIPWEFKFYDSWIDLGIAVAIYSQIKNKSIDKNSVFVWEIGLSWQILKSKLHEKREKEIPKWFDIIDYNVIKNIKDLINIV